MPATSADASKRLTRTNFRGPSLLQTINGKPTAISSSSPIQHTSRDGVQLRKSSSPDIDAPPESSDEDDRDDTKAPLLGTKTIIGMNGRHKSDDDSKAGAGEDEKKDSRRSSRSPKWLNDTSDAGKRQAFDMLENTNDDFMFNRPAMKKQKVAYGTVGRNREALNKTRISRKPEPKVKEDSGFKVPLDFEPVDSSAKEKTSGFMLPPDLSPRKIGLTSDTEFRSIPDVDARSDQELEKQIQAVKDFIVPSPVKDRPLPAPAAFRLPDPLQPNASTFPNSSLANSTFNDPGLFDTHSTSSSLSSPSSDIPIFSGQEQEEFDADIAAHAIAKCPLCEQPVPRALLEEYKSARDTRMRRQRQFCRGHKLKEANDTWRTKGYPTISWDDFEAKMKPFFPRLKKIIEDQAPSFYRNVLEDAMKSGEAKNLKNMIIQGGGASLSAGYYGPRGSQKMSSIILHHLSRLLRKHHTKDKLISAGGGVPQFVQMVLVPELTVMLVKEDMKVDDEEARVILIESEKIGMLLNGEEDEADEVRKVVMEREEKKQQGKEKEPAKRTLNIDG